MARECGGCTYCCKRLGIESLDKPTNQWCEHCNIGEGCKIYSFRPDECLLFQCVWLQQEGLPDSMRPDKFHVMYATSNDGKTVFVYTDPNRADSWRKQMSSKFIYTLLDQNITVFVVVDNFKIREVIKGNEPGVLLIKHAVNAREVFEMPKKGR